MSVGLYSLLTLSGATTSSLNVDHLQMTPESSRSDHWGTIQPIRSDEYNVGTPVQLSMLSTGGEPTLSVLGTEASLVHRYPVGPAQTVVFWDALLFKLGPVLPDAQLFAAHWWLPSLLVVLCMPTWFVLMGGRRHLGWLAGVLVVLGANNFWWSLQPTQVLAYTLAGCTALLAGAHRFERGQRWIPALQCVLGGVLIAGATSNYLVWSMLLGGGVLLASAVRILSRRSRRAWIALAISGAVALVLAVAVVYESRAGLSALTSTVYPGDRRESAQALDIGMLFGSPFLSALQHETPEGTNASELSTALNIALLVLPFAWLAAPRRIAWRARLGEFTLVAWSMGWLLWAMVSIGDLGQRIPLLSSVPPVRAAQAIGTLGVIALCLTLSHVRMRRTTGVALVAAALAAVVTVSAGSHLRAGTLPHLDLKLLWGAALALGVCVALLLLRSRSWYPPVVAAVCAAGIVIGASPLQFGLGDMRTSATAGYFAEQGRTARDSGDLWASNSLGVNAVMLANGVPTLSGLQRSGPDVEQWARIDPDGRFEGSWNRAGGYVNFAWDEGGPTAISDDGFDSVLVTIDPCTLTQDEPRLARVASTVALTDSPCLVNAGEITWQGQNVHVYEVQR